jgi:electron transfer flavoprotein alpha subunit
VAAVGPTVDLSARVLLGQAAVLADRVGARVIAIGRAEHARELVESGADEVIAPSGFAPCPLAATLASLPGPQPWAVLAVATDWGRELLARLAVRLQAGLLSDLTELDVQGLDHPQLIGRKPSGDGYLAELICRGSIQLATVRTGCLAVPRLRAVLDYPVIRTLPVAADSTVRILSHIVDDDHGALDRADVVVGVGRGVDPASYSEQRCAVRISRCRARRDPPGHRRRLASSCQAGGCHGPQHFTQALIRDRDIRPQ